MREVKLGITVPCCRDWKAAFGSSLVGLIHHVSKNGIAGVNLQGFDVNIMQGASVLPRARQLGIEWAKARGMTHLLCIDDDMAFPADILDGMLSHDVDILACNYVRKSASSPTPLSHDVEGNMMSSKDYIGIQEAGWIGFGFVVIKLDAVKDIPAPLFETRWMDDRKDFIGEDFYFCMKARGHGAKIYVDHDASQKISHIGDYAYREV